MKPRGILSSDDMRCQLSPYCTIDVISNVFNRNMEVNPVTHASMYGSKSLKNDQIRLLFLEPGEEADPLTGHLEIVDIKHCPAYEALSYEWGLPDKHHRFTATDSGAAITITDSLYHALVDLRPARPPPGASILSRLTNAAYLQRETSRHRVIWADAICINQDDIEERQCQVSIMGTIYRQASRVITYIGPESDGSAAGIVLASTIKRAFEDRVQIDLGDPAGLAMAGLPPATDGSWKALKALCLRRWAGRCWCAQEFLCNRNLIMMCGRTVLPDWTTIFFIVQLVYARKIPAAIIPAYDEDPDSLRDCLISLADLRSPLQYATGRTKKPLLSLLQSFHPFQVSDHRDKIYSLLSHSLDYEDLGIEIDYAIPAHELYTTVAAKIIVKYQDLKLLLSNLHHKSLSGLPSWVPDWSTWYFGSDLAGTGQDYVLSASGRTKPSLRIITRAGEEHHTTKVKLGVSGCLINEITWVGDQILPYYTTHEGPIAVQRRDWITRQLEIVRKLDPYPGTKPDVDTTTVLWKTLISNTNHNETAARDDYVDFFNAHYLYDGNSGVGADKEKVRRFCDAVRWRSRYRRVAITERGYFGAVPQTAEVGDWVCMFHGGRHLFVVRPMDAGAHGGEVGSDTEFRYVGHAYVHGLMMGEVLKEDWYEERKGVVVLV